MTGQDAKVERQNARELKEEEHLKRGERAFNKGRGEEGVCPPEDHSSLGSRAEVDSTRRRVTYCSPHVSVRY